MKEAILDAALELFLKKGYEQTSVTDIINSVGELSRGGFYHHFSSKEAVLLETPEHLKLSDHYFFDLLENQTITGLEKIKKLLIHGFKRGIENEREIKLVELLNDPRVLSIKINYLTEVVFDFYEQLIVEGVKDGSLVVSQPKMVAQMSAVLLNIWCQPTVFTCSNEELSQRFTFIRVQLNQMGLPVFDDEVWLSCQAYIRQFS